MIEGGSYAKASEEDDTAIKAGNIEWPMVSLPVRYLNALKLGTYSSRRTEVLYMRRAH